MRYQVIPVFYAANERFKNTIRFAIEFFEDIDPEALNYAVEQVQRRYPYFSVKIERDGEAFVQKLIQAFERHDIACRLMSEERFHLADYAIP